jgi:hypothetical protein
MTNGQPDCFLMYQRDGEFISYAVAVREID